jgi:flagellar motility protein MotE (MotC chaperone)
VTSDNYETSAERELSDELDAVRAENERLLHNAINRQEEIAALHAENERLRAAVEAYRTGLHLVESVTDIDVAHGYARAALDISADIGGGGMGDGA